MDAFHVPAPGIHRTESVIEKSRFIVSLSRVSNPEAAREFIRALKEEFPGANHNCWAFVCGPPGDRLLAGRGDDGEPAGTAGNPMLDALAGSDVGQVAAVATRFFGGIKLGTGGLVRAYGSVVRAGLEAMPRVRLEPLAEVRVRSTHARAHAALARGRMAGAELLEERWDEEVRLVFRLPASRAESLAAALVDATRGGEVLVGDVFLKQGRREPRSRIFRTARCGPDLRRGGLRCGAP